jgi:predicted Zn-dependent peptidase
VGTPESLDGIHRRALLDFKNSHYTAGAAFVVAAGNVDHRRLVQRVTRFLRALPPGARRAPLPVVERQTAPALRLFTKATEQTQIALGFRTCPRNDPRRFALRLLNTLLGENMSSRLFQVVREDRGLAYSIYSSVTAFADTGAFIISAGLDAENVPKTLRIVLKELTRLSHQPPDRREFRRARDYVLGQMDLGLENTESQMQWAGEQLVGQGSFITPATVRRRLAAVTPSEVSTLARTFFRPERLNLAMVSSLESTRVLDSVVKTFR